MLRVMRPDPIAQPRSLDRLADVESWIFDLDNTLYPAGCNLFAQVRSRMTDFIGARFGIMADEARALQRRYYVTYGTTLRGLMTHDGVDPHEFLEFVHDVDFACLGPVEGLRDRLQRLPGRLLIYTNASDGYARQVADRLGITDLFDGVFDIIAADFDPKPGENAFDRMLAAFDVEPGRAVFFEDIGRNLVPAAARGMATVLVQGSDAAVAGDDDLAHVDFTVEDLAVWLEGVLEVVDPAGSRE